MNQRWGKGGIKVVQGGTNMVKQMDKEIKRTGLHVDVADQNAYTFHHSMSSIINCFPG